MATPREKVANFIEKNIKAERDKYGCGMKNSYFDWDNFKDEWENFETVSENADYLLKEVNLLRKYLDENHRIEDFKEWKEKQQ